ncbi:MAG: 50S ribosomal protein L21 [Candidatus Paceibacterota bacterium]
MATGGKQYKVQEGDVITIEKLNDVSEGDDVTFEDVLLIDDGSKTDIGTPYIKGKKVTGKVEKEGRKEKIEVIRFRAKSRHFKNKGHRQPYMNIRIEKIS